MWKESVKHYYRAMRVCQKKDGNYTDEELDNFDEESKGFYQIWVKLHAEKGVTNYIHMFTC